MRRRTARLVVVGGASLLLLVGLTVGALTEPSGGAPGPSTSVTTTTGVTTSTCLPILITPTTGSGAPRVVTLGSPGTLAVGEGDNGTEYDVPIGTVLNVRLELGGIAGTCEHPSYGAPTASPAAVLRRPNGSDETSGSVATATFDVVGPGTATISSQLTICEPGCKTFAWSVSVVAAAPTPTSVLPRTE